MTSYILIEDEPKSRILMQQIMHEYFPNWRMLSVCGTVSEGAESIKAFNPDLVLMDIEIGEGTAFDLLQLFDEPKFKVLFISAYEHYALKAIKFAALDYIMKPIDVEELEKVLKKFEASLQPDNRMKEVKLIHEAKNHIGNIMIPTGKGFHLVKLDDIAYLEATGSYVIVHLIDRTQVLATHTLGYYEDLLSEESFFRVHKSFIVNVKHVSKVLTQKTLQIELTDGRTVDLAHRRKEIFLSALKSKNKN
jgi:two-component system LytT family response regulator